MNTPVDDPALLHGPGGPPRRIPLRAGPFKLEFVEGDLRRVRLGGHEVIRRLHGAVRDRNWGTVPGRISDLQVANGESGFQITYTCTHDADGLRFVWRGTLTGEADGRIRFVLDGEAKSTFLRNRIGLCVLHPAECAGAAVRVRRVDGSTADLAFPDLIEPRQPVPDIHDLGVFAHEVAPGTWAELQFAGDLFEMEDQRNWVDASFKTFSTPLRLPFPVEVAAGTRIRQEVRLALLGRPVPLIQVEADAAPVRLTLGTGRLPVPKLGLASAGHGQPLTPAEVQRLSELRLRHLRIDVRLGEPDWPARLRTAVDDSGALGLPLELAVHLPARGGETELAALLSELARRRPEIVRCLSHRAGEPTVSAESLALLRRHLGRLGVPIGAGTDADFCQLNQSRPPVEGADFIHWTINPQVHASDLDSLAETPAAIPAQFRTARALFPDRPLALGALSLKPRFNPVATGPAPAASPGSCRPRWIRGR